MLAAILASQLIGFWATALILLGSGETAPATASPFWAAGAGLCGIIGLGAFYMALARGTMGLIAPLAALIGAGLPAIVSVIAGETLGPLRIAGIVIALLAVVLISIPGGEASETDRIAARIDVRDAPLVVMSGLGFAGFYLFLDRAAAAGGDIWWSLLVVRATGLVVVLAVFALALRRAGAGTLRGRASGILGVARLRLMSTSLLTAAPLFVLAGLGDLGGNAFFVLANERDALAVAVVLSSLYPVVTTLLAALFLRERLRAWQMLGIGLAVAGVAMIGAGESFDTEPVTTP